MAKTLEERGYYIIDVHGHHGNYKGGKLPPVTKQALALREYLEHKTGTLEDLMAELPTEEQTVELFKKYGIKAAPVAWTALVARGEMGQDNDYIYELVKRHPDVFIGFWGSVDPRLGQIALEEAERCFRDLKVIGLKFQQASQEFCVNDPQFYPLWDLCQQYGAWVQFHGGMTGLGTGAPGGAGIKTIKYTNPADVDEVAADFPKLNIILMHACEPFTEIANLVTLHKGNIYRETSGMWPQYFPEIMVYEMNRRLRDKYMFGSEYPYFDIERLLDQHEEMEREGKYREGILEKLFYKNALNNLGERFENVGADLSPWKGLV